MTQSPHHTPALPAQEVRALARALSAGDVTVFVDGTALRLPSAARDAVLDVLARLGRGEAISVSSGAAGPDTPPAGVPAAKVAPAAAGTREPTARNGSNVPLLTTSQAAAAAGISHTYLRNLTDAGIIPVEYRGTHRRIRLSDVEAWLEEQQAKSARGQQG
ncbi:helix-turn-helix domain-containing protein [Arthrobacter citreus]|jgi:excisionase family DNA binding protein|uniref:Helix-turn-helix domain-containing protein n=1 Tax=Arthrobacter citreus TaxID=1670 RepID=A0ABZ2ZUR9_9MICC